MVVSGGKSSCGFLERQLQLGRFQRPIQVKSGDALGRFRRPTEATGRSADQRVN